MKRIAILGSTGSIGTQALDVVREHRDELEVVALTAHGNWEVLHKQIEEFRPVFAGLVEEAAARELAPLLPPNVCLVSGTDCNREAATLPEVDMVLVSVVGMCGLLPTLAAIRAGKKIALANKETLVAGGDLVMEAVRETNGVLLPVDSVHSAIHQSLMGTKPGDLTRILLTASGGPFRTWSRERIEKATVKDALNHPTWNMGAKVTVDSASLMNKGLEVIEAAHLFQVSGKEIKVLVHPQSIVHSMVELRDGAVIAQLGVPDMRLPIQLALMEDERRNLSGPRLDFASIGRLTFEDVDMNRFPALRLAYEALECGGLMPVAFNAAGEVAVAAFLKERIPFGRMAELVERAMVDTVNVTAPDLDSILEFDLEVRRKVALWMDVG